MIVSDLVYSYTKSTTLIWIRGNSTFICRFASAFVVYLLIKLFQLLVHLFSDWPFAITFSY
jgi:hypothetical protein